MWTKNAEEEAACIEIGEQFKAAIQEVLGGEIAPGSLEYHVHNDSLRELCMYVCMYVCVCVFVCVCMCMCVCFCVYLQLCICMCVCIFVYVYVRMYMYVCMYMYMCVCIYVCVCGCCKTSLRESVKSEISCVYASFAC